MQRIRSTINRKSFTNLLYKGTVILIWSTPDFHCFQMGLISKETQGKSVDIRKIFLGYVFIYYSLKYRKNCPI